MTKEKKFTTMDGKITHTIKRTKNGTVCHTDLTKFGTLKDRMAWLKAYIIIVKKFVGLKQKRGKKNGRN